MVCPEKKAEPPNDLCKPSLNIKDPFGASLDRSLGCGLPVAVWLGKHAITPQLEGPYLLAKKVDGQIKGFATQTSPHRKEVIFNPLGVSRDAAPILVPTSCNY